ncbi:hypothetical protein F0310_04685 (plasmid) [Borrelia sp. A-FGy1]|uniref:Bdr family repetitive protein n=1 Tax=Borrelia sp. A-FGy1 TaxID=2608247 RepID=UPI0015F54445|nr:Bdr family repetitive protein [Borrelia sp. A-FGy1]QMU99713.1 hypothetical protein F0310_04685 [Borrelia sp. A-FGy1]
MSNIAGEAKPKYEYVKQVFLDKDFPEDVIDYVLLRSSNYVYENLSSSMNMLEGQMNKARDEFRSGIGKLDEKVEKVRGELSAEIKTVRSELKVEIVKLDEKVEKVRSELSAEIKAVRSELKVEIVKLDEKVEKVRSELKVDISKLDEKINTNHKELVEMFKDSISKFSKELQDSKSESNKYIKSLIYPFYWILGIFIPLIGGMFLYLLQK